MTLYTQLAQKDAELALAVARTEQQAALSEALARKSEVLEGANGQLMEAHKVILFETQRKLI